MDNNKFNFDYETACKNFVSQKNSEQRLWEKAMREQSKINLTVDEKSLTTSAKKIDDALKRVFG